ncbi:FAD-dependent oxidoreductase [Haloarculaceae archaeon H-GB2-1]|nr:FAD-dependent oxidoreductase [Haloarculaceae archaeon H-GB1-1]MEA5385852.1 FAD-dependent oxidoreductase [Haloarculaceae archaeon H-GB11]MEA5407356.1 FAD-dependent oxidoreductase [Haloarculaceae archaeon H-GB2-1]
MTPSVAVVGAGISGIGVAYALRDDDVDVTLFEQGREVSGRAATRYKQGCTYDYGANYVRTEDDWLLDVLDNVAQSGRVDIDEPVWTFDEIGTISESDREQAAKWTYADGIAQLGKELLAETDATVHRETRVASLVRTGDGWYGYDGSGREWGEYDVLVLTPPAPQSADLIGSAEWQHPHRRRIREQIESIPYRTVISVVLHYPFELDRDYFALVNEDKTHDVWWCSREECKQDHVPDGESLLVVQLSPDWSAEHFHDDATTLADEVASLTADLVGDDRLTDPDWHDFQHWRYAQPEAGLDVDATKLAAQHDLYCAGDWVAGRGRLHLALKSGLETGADVARSLS